MPLNTGQRLGAYEISALVGAGGMGEVYRARDTRLNRDVALKVLPPRMASDALAFARFEREAQAVAALSHPNILAVYDLGQIEGTPYVVFELLQGASLRELLVQGPLPLHKALDYARQIADGLAAAHEKAITHRDIKPDNVFVTGDGRVKILDFGLATASAGRSDDALTRTFAPVTEAGTLLGTVGYMAPEQVRGLAVDQRTDLFALGCVLYEMCTGARAFKGETPADTMTAVLASDPPELTLPRQATPPALSRIVRRCLEKSPAERFQSARDLSFAIDALASLSSTTQDVPAARPTSRRSWAPIAAASAVALAGGLLAGRLFWGAAPAPSVAPGVRLRAEFPSPLATGPSLMMSLSPDGRYLMYSDVAPEGVSRLVVRDLGTGEITPVPGGLNGISVAWSPRSDGLLFLSDDRDVRRHRLGERTSTMLMEAAEEFNGAAWLADETVVFAVVGDPPVRRMPVAGGPATPVVMAGEYEFKGLSPLGRRTDYVLAMRRSPGSGIRNAVTIRLADGQVSEIAPTGAIPAWSMEYLLLPRVEGLYALPFDTAGLAVTGEPVLVTESIAGDPANGMSSLAASASGVLAYRAGRDRNLVFEWFDLKGTSLGAVGPQGVYGSFALSPDGSRVIVRQITGVGPGPASGLLLLDLSRGVTSPIATPDGPPSDPIWTADGTRIVYRAGNQVVRQSPYSNGREVVREGLAFPDHASPDGRWFILGVPRPGGGFGLFVVPASDQGAPQPLADDAQSVADEGSFSPSGRLVSYQSSRSGRVEVYLARFPPTDERWQVSSRGGVQPRWSPDGRWLYYLELDGQLMRVAVPEGQPDGFGRPEALFRLPVGPPSATLEQYAVHGDRLLVLHPATEDAPQTITVVGNWAQGLRQPAR